MKKWLVLIFIILLFPATTFAFLIDTEEDLAVGEVYTLDISEPKQQILYKGDQIKFKVDGAVYTLQLKNIKNDYITLIVDAAQAELKLDFSEFKAIDVDGDTKLDIAVTLLTLSRAKARIQIETYPPIKTATTIPLVTTTSIRRATSSILLQQPLEVYPSCSDGIKNQDEQQVDCGGSCKPCAQSSSLPAIIISGILLLAGSTLAWYYLKFKTALPKRRVVNSELVDYIHANLSRGFKKGQIEKILLKKKWTKKQITKAFKLTRKR